MPVIDRAIKHYQNLAGEPKIIEVAEWPDDEAKPTLIHVKPITCAEYSKIERLSKGDDINTAVQTIVVKALDEDGEKMFEKEDAIKIKQLCDMAVVTRIAGEICETLTSTEDAEKN